MSKDNIDLMQVDGEGGEGPEPTRGPYYVRYWRSVADGRWYWHARGWNHEIICSGGAVKSQEDCEHQIEMIHNQLAAVPIELIPDPNAEECDDADE